MSDDGVLRYPGGGEMTFLREYAWCPYYHYWDGGEATAKTLTCYGDTMDPPRGCQLSHRQIIPLTEFYDLREVRRGK
jgi:hypothetical protein